MAVIVGFYCCTGIIYWPDYDRRKAVAGKRKKGTLKELKALEQGSLKGEGVRGSFEEGVSREGLEGALRKRVLKLV